MIKQIYFTFIIVCSMIVINSTFTGRTGCPDLSLFRNLKNLDLSRFMGKWFEVARKKNNNDKSKECGTVNYTIKDKDAFTVEKSDLVFGNWKIAKGKAKPTKDPFKFKVSFNDNFLDALKGDYQIFDTDYSTYAIIYMCKSFLVSKSEHFYILSRTPEISNQVLNGLIDNFSNKLKIDKDKIRITNQSKETCDKYR